MYCLNVWIIIENHHWHLDVTFGEDQSRARRGYASENLSTIRKPALQTIKEHNGKLSLKKGGSGQHMMKNTSKNS
jgi:predicted transposase YbfD/YdcC